MTVDDLGAAASDASEPTPESASVARLVADHWRKAALESDDLRLIAHPLCMVLAALDGETNPDQLGITPDSSEAAAIRALTPPLCSQRAGGER